MRFLLALTLAATACSGDPPAPPADAARADAADDLVTCAGLIEFDPCDCAEPFRGRRGARICVDGSPVCFCQFPDAADDAVPEAAVDAVAVADVASDAAAPTDAAPPPVDAVAVADAVADAPRDATPDRYNCANEGPPRCIDNGPCAVCLPSAGGAVWCCRSGFCRLALDRSSCE